MTLCVPRLVLRLDKLDLTFSSGRGRTRPAWQCEWLRWHAGEGGLGGLGSADGANDLERPLGRLTSPAHAARDDGFLVRTASCGQQSEHEHAHKDT